MHRRDLLPILWFISGGYTKSDDIPVPLEARILSPNPPPEPAPRKLMLFVLLWPLCTLMAFIRRVRGPPPIIGL